ncbi:MAG TPA: VWA domain-containing protein [Pyrinomonadaceae bacterium]|nr:VWA domain-containing protein [Pyrinomonadaceae bacterium]
MTLPRPVHIRRHVFTRAARQRFLLPLLAPSLVIIIFNLCVCAQTTNAPDTDEVLRVSTDLITVPVVVTDARGRRFAGLTLSDFRVSDGGRPVKLDYFSAGTERVAVLFALDASGSAREHIARQTEAALAMFTRFGSNSRIAVLPFAAQAEFALPFTADINSARGAFQLSARRNQNTAIFDAAAVALRAFNVAGADARERRIIILSSDGLDTASRTTPDAVINQARLRGVSIYVIHFPLYTPQGGQLVVRRPAKGFRELAKQTGGHYFRLGDARTALDPRATYDLAPIFRAIAEDLQSQYMLGYYLDAAARDKSEHHIQVSLAPTHKLLRVQMLREPTLKAVTGDK